MLRWCLASGKVRKKFLFVLFFGILIPFMFITMTMRLRSEFFEGFDLNSIIKPTSLSNERHDVQCTKPNDPNHHEKWIVMTSINNVTEAVKIWSTIPGYQVLVVGDRKTPKAWRYPGVIFLDIDQQYKLGYKISRMISEGHYARKNIGYLYAIQHGAKFIYETDDDNVPWPHATLNDFYTDSDTYSGLVIKSYGAYNMFSHFGQSNLWPRGYPLNKMSHNVSRDYSIETMRTPIVQQGGVNGDPDVDALVRLTRKSKYSNINVTFDSSAPPVVLPEGVMSPYNSQNTMISYRGFWLLYLPCFEAMRVTDIWRSYWSQRLMWMTGDRVMYLPPTVYQFRNPHDFIADMRDENRLYSQSHDLIEFLINWKCTVSSSYSCFKELGENLAARNFIADKEVEVINAWIDDLQAVCYNPPEMVTHNSADKDNHVVSSVKIMDKMRYYPVEQKSSYIINDRNGAMLRTDYYRSIMNYLYGICSNSPESSNCNDTSTVRTISNIMATSLKSELQIKPLFNDVLLVVVYNHPDASNLPLINSLYRLHFPNMIICGYIDTDQSKADSYHFSYLPSKVYKLINTSDVLSCLKSIAKMNYNVNGYLVIQDDVLLNFWNLLNHDKDKIWSTYDWKIFNSFGDAQINRNVDVNGLVLKSQLDPWIYPADNIPKIKKTLTRLKNSGAGTNGRRCHEILKKRLKGDMRFDYAQCDIFHLPKRLWKSFADVVKVFEDEDVFFEIACPTTLRCIEEPTKHEELEFSHFNVNSKPSKPNLWKHYPEMISRPYIHPYKFSGVINKDAERVKAFCHDLLPEFLKTFKFTK